MAAPFCSHAPAVSGGGTSSCNRAKPTQTGSVPERPLLFPAEHGYKAYVNKTVIERAFEIAPECGTLEEIRQRLVREGYMDVAAHLDGKLIKMQLHERLHPELRKPYSHRVR
jgi:hypothetical protein